MAQVKMSKPLSGDWRHPAVTNPQSPKPLRSPKDRLMRMAFNFQPFKAPKAKVSNATVIKGQATTVEAKRTVTGDTTPSILTS